jgi:hypothetical protein
MNITVADLVEDRGNFIVAEVSFISFNFLLLNRYKLCEALELVCAQCYKKYAFAGVSEILTARATPNGTPSTSAACPDSLICAECNRYGGFKRISLAMLANQVDICNSYPLILLKVQLHESSLLKFVFQFHL